MLDDGVVGSAGTAKQSQPTPAAHHDRFGSGEREVVVGSAALHGVGDIGNADMDVAAVGASHSRDQIQQGGLAASVGADHHGERGRCDLQIEPVEHRDAAIAERHAGQLDPGGGDLALIENDFHYC